MTYGILQARSGTAAEWASLNPVLEAGEIGHVAPDSPGGDYSLKIGDGVSAWNDLPTISGGGGAPSGVQSVNGKPGPDVTLTASDVGAKAANWEPDLSGYIQSSMAGVANGIATLNSFGKVPLAQLPDTDLTPIDGTMVAVIWNGSWPASRPSPSPNLCYVAVGGSTAPTWLLQNDLHLKDLLAP